MQTRIGRMFGLALSVLVLGAGAAMAQVDVELAFTPDTAVPGQPVTLFASLANLSSEPAQTHFTVTIALGSLTTGAMPFDLPLAAGAERSAEIPFVVPPIPMGGTLTITVTATAGEATDTATASLTIETGTMLSSDTTTLGTIGTRVGKALTGDDDATPTNPASMSDVKRLYRD